MHKTIETWDGRGEAVTIEYDVEESSGALSSQSTVGMVSVDRDFYEADLTDYVVSASCGVLTGLLDVFWVGEFSLENAQDWGRSNINRFVIKVANLRGYKKDGLEGAIRFLEKDAPMASDKLTNEWGGGLQHHFRDFAHHASVGGLIFSILSQFTGMSYGTNTEGHFVTYDIPDPSLLGTTIENRLYNGIVLWALHLVSDMAGSSSNAGGGTGIPGPLLSLAKELSVLPGINDLKVKYNGNDIELSVMLSKIFNGTAFEHTSNKDLKRFDLRTEIGVYAHGAKQSLPVIINQCLIRAFYFVRRFLIELKVQNITGVLDFASLNPTHFVPYDNACIRRMATISSGIFCVVDLSDAALRGKASGGGFVTNFLLRANFVGVGNFLISLCNDMARSSSSNYDLPADVNVNDVNAGDAALLENIVIDVSFERDHLGIDATGIYNASFFRMYKDVKETFGDVSAAQRCNRGVQIPLLQLEDDETDLYDSVAYWSKRQLLIETGLLLKRLLALNTVGYVPADEKASRDYYIPFIRVENGEKIAYMLTSGLTSSIPFEEIIKGYNVDRIKEVALVELGEDQATRDEILRNMICRTRGVVEFVTVEEVFSLISADEYQTYKAYVTSFNADVKRLLGYRTIVTPSEASLGKLRESLEEELNSTDFGAVLIADGIFKEQVQVINNNFYGRGLYKAITGEGAFAESFISSEWYFQTHIDATSVLEQTAVITGYLKSVEQLLYRLICNSVNSGKRIRSRSGGLIPFTSENEMEIDSTLHSLISYVRYYADLWNVNNYARRYVADKLDSYRCMYRNDYFHKDNINDADDIIEIRTATLQILYLLLGAMKIDEPQRLALGAQHDYKVDAVVPGLNYADMEGWLDRILGGDVLLSEDSTIYFWGKFYGADQCQLQFVMNDRYSDKGELINWEMPYVSDDLKWYRTSDSRVEAERQAKEALERYLKEGKYAEKLKHFKKVSVGWLSNHIELYNRDMDDRG